MVRRTLAIVVALLVGVGIGWGLARLTAPTRTFDPMADPPRLAVPEADLPVVDQLAWLEQLLRVRPELVMQHEGGIGDPGWQALVIRPEHRAELLAWPTSTWRSIVAREYTPDLVASDEAWAAPLREAERTFVPDAGVRASTRNAERETSYRVGAGPAYDADGVGYKVFLGFHAFQRALTADRYIGFHRALAHRGFDGDSKFALTDGLTRFNYNQVVMHMSSPALGLCAEAVAIEWFGAELQYVARGLDVMWEKQGFDWHHFLLTWRYHKLPEEARDYVRYRTPVPAQVCPG